MEFATFVMARHNYPFENMSVPDAEALFADARVKAPGAADVECEWNGHLILLETPDTSLLNQVSPVLFHATWKAGAAKCLAAGLEFGRGFQASELRLLGATTLLGRWAGLDSAVAKALGETIWFVLTQGLRP